MELTFDLPGTPEQVWQAIATANGITAWFLPTDLEEREGGAVCFHMGDDDSPGTVTGWEPPRRLEYSEPDWATLTGHDAASVTPMLTEFLVEARAGSTCVLRVVSSAFGTGADWEQEFFDQMEQGWAPFFDNLRLYLSRFAGQKVTSLYVTGDVPGTPDAAWPALLGALGAERTGQRVEVRGLTGEVDRISASSSGHPQDLRVVVDEPFPGWLGFGMWPKDDHATTVAIVGYLFADGAAAYVEREEPAWHAWLADLPVPAA
jgi:uncharacterized protein YndB with AHSA1/START domain